MKPGESDENVPAPAALTAETRTPTAEPTMAASGSVKLVAVPGTKTSRTRLAVAVEAVL